MKETMTVAEYQALPKRQPKYGNKKTVIDNITFDSQAEAARYRELRTMERAGAITELEVHPRYELLGAFTDRHGKRHKAIWYEADFRYFEGRTPVVEDCKGCVTEVFRIKEKLFRRWYSHLDLRIIKV